MNSSNLSKPLLDFCADCKKCEEFCPVGIPTGDLLLKLKEKKGPYCWERSLSRVFRHTALMEWSTGFLSRIQKAWEKDGHLRKLPFPWFKNKRIPAIRKDKNIAPLSEIQGETVYLFQGCLAKMFFPEIRNSILSSLAHFGYRVIIPENQVCCGAPSLHLGRTQDVRLLLKKNWESIERENPDFILTVCPTGNSMLKRTYSELEPSFSRWTEKIYDYAEFLVSMGHIQGAEGEKGGEDVYYHYPCHYLNDLKLKDEPKRIIEAAGYNPIDEGEPQSCCGFCGVFSLKNPKISEKLWQRKKESIEKTSVRTVATDCPGCVFQLRACLQEEQLPFRIVFTAELLAEAIRTNKIRGKETGKTPPQTERISGSS